MTRTSSNGLYLRAAAAGLFVAASLSNVAAAPRGVARRFSATGDSLVGGPVVGNGPHLAAPLGVVVEASGTIAIADARWRTVFRIDPVTGHRSTIADAPEDEVARRPLSIVADDDGTVVVGEAPVSVFGGGALVHFDAQGARTILSGEGIGSGPGFQVPAALAREASGSLLVGARNRNALLRVDPLTGDRVTLSGCTQPSIGPSCGGPIVGSGPDIASPQGLAVEPTGAILLAQPGMLLRVHPVSGDRTVVADATSGSGPALGSPAAIVVEMTGAVLWDDATSSSLIRLDPATGDRVILSGGALGSGIPFKSLSGLSVDLDGNAIVTDVLQGLVVRVHPVTGDRVAVSGGPVNAGPLVECPTGLVVEASGDLVVADRCAEALIRIDATTGDRTVVSDATHGSGPPLQAPLDVALEGFGELLVVGGTELLRVDPGTGDRTVVSNAMAGTGSPFLNPATVAVEASGSILVGDDGRDLCILIFCLRIGRALIRVDPGTGDRVLLSGGGAIGRRAAKGPTFDDFLDLAVEPSGTILVGTPDENNWRRLRYVDPITGDRSMVLRRKCCDEFRATGLATTATGEPFVANGMVVSEVVPAQRDVTLVSGSSLRVLPTDPVLPSRGVGPPYQTLRVIAVEENGTLIVADTHPARNDATAILRVDPETGDRVYLSR